MKFPNWKKPERNAQLSEQEINELLHTANTEGITHEKPGVEPIATGLGKGYRDGNTWKDEQKKEVKYEDN